MEALSFTVGHRQANLNGRRPHFHNRSQTQVAGLGQEEKVTNLTLEKHSKHIKTRTYWLSRHIHEKILQNKKKVNPELAQ